MKRLNNKTASIYNRRECLLKIEECFKNNKTGRSLPPEIFDFYNATEILEKDDYSYQSFIFKILHVTEYFNISLKKDYIKEVLGMDGEWKSYRCFIETDIELKDDELIFYSLLVKDSFLHEFLYFYHL